MARHSALCLDSGARHCVATRLCARNREALSGQCGVVLHRDREGHARATDLAGRALQSWRTMSGRARQMYYVTIDFL